MNKNCASLFLAHKKAIKLLFRIWAERVFWAAIFRSSKTIRYLAYPVSMSQVSKFEHIYYIYSYIYIRNVDYFPKCTFCTSLLHNTSTSLCLTLWHPSSLNGTFWQNFDFKIRRDHCRTVLWEPCLWVGRRCEPILGYISNVY